MLKMENISAVLFDFDGTLVDSEKIYIEAGVRAMVTMGVAADYALDFNRRYFAGLRFDQKPIAFGHAFPHLVYDQYLALYQQNLVDLQASMPMKLKPGAVEILQYLKRKGYHIAVVTMSTYETVQAICDQIGLDFKLFDYYFGGSGCPAKPDPAIYLEAMRVLAVTPEQTLIVEDSNVGGLAAIRSGANVVVVKDESILSDEVLTKANYVFEKDCLIRVKEIL